MHNERPYVMSIAGYDPSGGAGVLADIKVIEQHKAYGFGVITSNTFQDDKKVKAINWINDEDILRQIDVILDSFSVTVFKIGITNSSDSLMKIKKHVLKKTPDAFIVWDPVIVSSSGFEIFKLNHSLEDLLNGISLITPNLPEYTLLFSSDGHAKNISKTTSIYLKGGHSKKDPGKDILLEKMKSQIIEAGKLSVSAKHGSGCILSSAISANLALKMNLKEACKNAKQYTEKVLASNSSLLGYHNFI